jgi:single-stranded DNA-binding protein
MTEAAVSFAGNLADDPEVRSTEAGIAGARFRVARSTGSSPTGNLTTFPSST